MTISSSTSKSGPYNGNGVTTVFARNFRVLSDDHLKVYQTVSGVTTEVTTGITKDGIGSDSGNVTFATAPATGVQITLIREIPLTQETDYSSQGKVSPEQVEDDLDIQQMQIQDLNERLGRALVLPITAGAVGLFPGVADRIIGFNGDADGFAVAGSTRAKLDAAIAFIDGLSGSIGVTDAANIIYRPSLTGDVSRSVKTKLAEFVSITDFGAVGDGVTDDTSAIEAALASGAAHIYVPDKTFAISDRIELVDGVTLFGSRGSVILQSAADKAHFRSNGLDYFRIQGLTLKGNISSTGVTGVDDRGAVVVSSTEYFEIEGCKFEQHSGSGVTISRQGTYVNGGVIRNCHFVKGVQGAAADEWGTQDNAPVQIYQYGKNIVFEGNKVEGRWYCAALLQDQVNDGASRIYGNRFANNTFEGLSQYGFVCYTLQTLTISATAASGSDIRITTNNNHNMQTGDVVFFEGSADANGLRVIERVSDTQFDVPSLASTATVTIGGRIRMSKNCGGVFIGNSIDGIEGDREFAAGNNPYGAAFYIQAAGDILVQGLNVVDASKNTNSETLTPGTFGVNVATGHVTLDGFHFDKCNYHAFSIKTQNAGAHVRICNGTVDRVNKDAISMRYPQFVTIENVNIETTDKDSDSSRIFSQNVGRDVSLINIKAPAFRAPNYNIIEMQNIDNLVVRGCEFRNVQAASAVCEVARFISCDGGRVDGNIFDGGASAYSALKITGSTDMHFANNTCRMQDDGAARACVSMSGTCTGTVFDRSNNALATDGTEPRMENTSTDGRMHTCAPTNQSGGKTRQIGDTIENSEYADTEALFWAKTAASAGGSDWNAVTPA